MNKKVLYTFLINCLLIITSEAQDTTYFDIRYDASRSGTVDRSFCIIEAGNQYVLAGYALNSTETKWNMILTSFDHSGEVNWVKSVGDNTSNYSMGFPGSLIQYDADKFYSVGFKRTNTSYWTHDEIILSCYNGEFDTLWTKLYGEKTEPYDTAHLFHQLKKTSDDHLILGGEWMPKGKEIRMCLIKTDTMGNMLWKQSFGSGNGYYRGYSVIETSDKGFALGGCLFYIGEEKSGDPLIVKTDSLGNEQWKLTLGGEYPDHVAMLCNTNDGNFVAAYSYADTMYTQYDPHSRICLTKINNEGDILWEKFYGHTRHNNYTLNVIELDNGCMVIVGSVISSFPVYSGWILKTKPNGDSLWYREYKNLYGEDSRNYLNDITSTSDNGLAACGYVWPVLPDTGYDDTWILKLDSLGCDTPGCDPTVGIPYRFEGDKSLQVYPNPARERFVVSSSLFAKSNCSIQLFDLYGRKVKEIKVPVGEIQIIVDVEEQRAGLYLLRLRSDTGQTESVKVVVE